MGAHRVNATPGDGRGHWRGTVASGRSAGIKGSTVLRRNGSPRFEGEPLRNTLPTLSDNRSASAQAVLNWA